MSTFDERKDAFENKFAHEQNLTFKIEALRNKMLGAWVAELKGLDEEKTEQYIKEVVKSDFQEAGDEDVFRKLQADLVGIADDQEIRTKMNEYLQSAKDKFSNIRLKRNYFYHKIDLLFLNIFVRYGRIFRFC